MQFKSLRRIVQIVYQSLVEIIAFMPESELNIMH